MTRPRLACFAHDRPGVDDAPAQGQVRIVGVGRPAIVVQVDVRQLGVRLAEKVVKGAADGGVTGVEDEAALAKIEVAGRAEVREADSRHVLDDDAHAELALQFLALGERALQSVDDARVASDGAAAVVGVHRVDGRSDLGGRLEVPPVDLHRAPPIALPRAARIEVVVRAGAVAERPASSPRSAC